jgi:predicted nucleic-acid-binding protein
MVSLDTNILARYLLNDTPAQAIIVEQLLEREPFTVPITVFLELAWVLQSQGCTRGEIAAAISSICGLRNFNSPDINLLTTALYWYENNIDFADSLHLAMSSGSSEFKTLDKAMVKTAKRLATNPSVSFP